MRIFILIMVSVCTIMGGLIIRDHRAIIELKRESGLNEKLMVDLNKRTDLIKRTFKRIDIIATGYCLCKICTKYKHGLTSTSMNANINVIAVDPTVIPYGSIVYIDGLGGVYVAGDSGSKIKGNRVDIFFNTHEEAVQFGIKRLTAWVL